MPHIHASQVESCVADKTLLKLVQQQQQQQKVLIFEESNNCAPLKERHLFMRKNNNHLGFTAGHTDLCNVIKSKKIYQAAPLCDGCLIMLMYDGLDVTDTYIVYIFLLGHNVALILHLHKLRRRQ